jgi:hypothetical protein
MATAVNNLVNECVRSSAFRRLHSDRLMAELQTWPNKSILLLKTSGFAIVEVLDYQKFFPCLWP